ncbi:hypothetical protein L7F22_045872 [Adiantum nelumboides]|nr:hypothetical protein [Adiantum nelumboides]
MGEMAMRTRPRKDLAASFHRLKRMVIDVKSARKSLVAHHSVVAELVSVAFYSSSKAPLPCDRDDPQEESFCLADWQFSPPSQSPYPPTQPNDLQDAGIEAQSSLPCSLPKTLENSYFSSLRLLAVKDSASLFSSPVTNGDIFCPSSSLQESDSVCSKLSRYPGKRSSQAALWASLLLVFLSFFLHMGKEIAVVVAIIAYIVIRFARRIQIVQRQRSDSHFFADSISCNKNHLDQTSNLGRSSTVPKDIIFCSSDPQAPPARSQSFPMLNSCLQGEFCLKDRDLSLCPKISAATTKALQSFCARFKLSAILVLALCGLAHSHFVAVCLCLCCIFLLSFMQELAMRIYRLKS